MNVRFTHEGEMVGASVQAQSTKHPDVFPGAGGTQTDKQHDWRTTP